MDKPITLCDRCDIYMSCLLDYDGPACRRDRTVEPTNADRIRGMTDEELANIICCQNNKSGDECFDADCYSCTLDWLREENRS